MKISNLLLQRSGFVKTNISILPFLIALLSNQTGAQIDENNVEEYISRSPIEVGNYIVENTSAFIESYNEGNSETWKATSVERNFKINVIDPDECFTSMFIDFDLDNGYAILGIDYSFLCLEISGESPFKDIEADSYNYYVATSFFTYVIDDIEYDIDGISEQYLQEHKEELFGIEDNLPKKAL